MAIISLLISSFFSPSGLSASAADVAVGQLTHQLRGGTSLQVSLKVKLATCLHLYLRRKGKYLRHPGWNGGRFVGRRGGP